MSVARSRAIPSILMVMCLGIVGAIPVFPGAARADTAADLAEALEDVNELQSQAEAAYQDHALASARLAEINNNIAVLQTQLHAQTAAVEAARAAMGRAARNSYMASGVDAGLYLLLSDDGTAFTEALNDLQRVSESKTATLSTSRELEARLRDTTDQVAAQRVEAQRLSEQAERSAQAAHQTLDRAQARYEQIKRRYAAELAAEQERRRQQDAAAAAAARAAQPAAAAQGSAAQGSPDPGSAVSSDARQAVVNFALSKLGYRYIFGADGPNAYDCSGLTAAAYAAAGVGIASYTHSQAKVARSIPLSQARPGDLLFFFGRGASHVAIYLGDGRMVHAVNPRAGVTTNHLSEAWYRDRLTMVGTLLP